MHTHGPKIKKEKKKRAGELGQWIRALVALEEDKGSIYNTCMVVHKLHVL